MIIQHLSKEHSSIDYYSIEECSLRLCPGVPVHRGNNYCTPLFTSLCLAVAYCWVYCIGSCVPVHKDRTLFTKVLSYHRQLTTSRSQSSTRRTVEGE